jgi:hypothetical protein
MKPGILKTRSGVFLSILLFFSFSSFSTGSPAQKGETQDTLRCTRAALRAMRALPELNYPCADDDEVSLKSPARKRGLKKQVVQFEQFTSPAWWAADVEALNLCAVFKKPRAITRDEFISRGYAIDIHGDAQTRLIVTTDPCVKYSYATLNVFVLQRAADKVVVTQILDGYFSRADNAVGMGIANLGSERILEIWADTGGLDPHSEAYLFTIHPQTHRPVPKRIIRDGNEFTHKMTSCVALEIWANKYEFDLPKDWQEMRLIQNAKLADKFYVYSEGQDKLERNVFKWNGKNYVLEP